MKVIDLTHSSKHKINAEIDHFCGGKSIEKFWLAGFQKGLGGFSFTDPQSDVAEEKFMSSLAFYNAGIGIYCRNMYKNFLVLIPENIIIRMEIIKQQDIISPYRLSLFTLLKNIGVSDHTACKYLMPKEIIMESKPQFTIHTTDKYLSLEIDKISPDTLIKLLKKTKFAAMTDIQLESPHIKHRML
jgi:hypothetical protein